MLVTPGRLGYLVALLLPLLLLPLAAPLLAAAALPQLFINLFASWGPVQSVQYHYAVLLVPFLMAAALLGSPACAIVSSPCGWRGSGPSGPGGGAAGRGGGGRGRPPGTAADLGLDPRRMVGEPAPRTRSRWTTRRGRCSARSTSSPASPGVGRQRGRGSPVRAPADPALRTGSATPSTSWWPTASFRRMAQAASGASAGVPFAALRLARSNRWEPIFDEEEVRVYRRIPPPRRRRPDSQGRG